MFAKDINKLNIPLSYIVSLIKEPQDKLCNFVTCFIFWFHFSKLLIGTIAITIALKLLIDKK